MLVTKKSPLTGIETTVDLDITQAQLIEWQQGGLIQDVMPDLTPDERQFLMTGYTPADWIQIFGPEE